VIKVATVTVRFEVFGETPVPPGPEDGSLNHSAAQGRRSRSWRRSAWRSPCAAAVPLLWQLQPAAGDAIASGADRDRVHRDRARWCDGDRHPVGTSRTPGSDPRYGWPGALRIEPGLQKTDHGAPTTSLVRNQPDGDAAMCLEPDPKPYVP